MRNENCSESRISLRYLMICLVIAIIFTSLGVNVYAAPGDKLSDKVEEVQTDKVVDAILASDTYYPSYIQAKDDEGYANYSGKGVLVDLSKTEIPEGLKLKDYLLNEYTSQELNETFSGSFIDWKENSLGWIDLVFDIETKGYYNIEIEYYTPTGSVQTPQRSLNIDGDLPFIEAAIVDFDRLWEDSSKALKINTVGDQIRPKQNQVFGMRNFRVSDHDGKYSTPLRYAFDKGDHKIRLVYQYEPVVIKSVKLVAPKDSLSYAEYLNEKRSEGARDATTPIRMEGEDVTYKSHPVLRMDASSDPAAYPSFDKGNTRLNVIGGSSWASSNQTLIWKVQAETSGLYKLAFRSYAKYTDGIPVFRQIKINGEVPFEEFECYEIPFSDWDCYSLNDEEGNPYLVYLEEGENTLEISVKLGEVAAIMNALEEDANNLSLLVKDITKITGTLPDPNFDYKLDEKVENLEERLTEITASFQNQIDRISNLSAKRPAAVNNFVMMKQQFDRMIADTDIIPKSYESLNNAMINLATWIKEFGKQPLQLDYIEFLPPDAEVEVVKSTFWQRISAAFTSFMVSFVKDYDGVGTDADGNETVVLDVWISRGKEWAEILKQQSDEDFFVNKNIAVKMNILPSGQLNASAGSVLLLALASGTGPDACLGVAANLPVEYGMRGAIHPLSSFDDFKEIFDEDKVENRFLNGIMIPFYFTDAEGNGEYYGLPETMDFQCLYYRKDVMSDYRLEIPNTWDDIYSKILPILNNEGMDFYYAGGYNPFLFQNSGEYFLEGNRDSAWNSPEAVNAFKQWTDLYTIYDVPVTADFYNRFRNGQMPIGIGGIDIYTKLVSAAPEITGKWGVAPMPGIVQEDGTINRASGGGTTACIILNDSDKKDEAWEFIKWYTDAETQVQYANDIKTIIGPEAIWASANVDAFNQLPWDAELKTVISEYQKWYKDPPNVVGGYIVGRYLENARVTVVVDHGLYRPALEKAVSEIDRELEIKNKEFERRAEYEAAKNKE